MGTKTIYVTHIVGGDIKVTTGGSVLDSTKTQVKYTAESGLPDWEGDIVGELTSSSIPNIEQTETVDIGNTVTGISQYAFSGCSGLTSVTIPDSVTGIGRSVFSYCKSLTSVTIPASVTIIGDGTFNGCTGLTSVTFLGKTLEQVQNIEDGNGNKQYPWGISDTSIITVA